MFDEDNRRWILLTLACLMLAIVVRPAHATHENDHRFTVYGTVRNGASFPGVPLPNRAVTVLDAATQRIMQRGVTDAAGKYSLVLHVHNGDVGKVVLVQSAGISRQITLQFDPGDVTTVRRAQVDLVVFPK